MPRYSIRENDPGFLNFSRDGTGGFESITLNGVDVNDRCIMADEEVGEVLLHKRNEDGQFYLNGAGNETAKETLNGEVVVTPRARLEDVL